MGGRQAMPWEGDAVTLSGALGWPWR